MKKQRLQQNFTEDQLQDIFFNMKRVEIEFNTWNEEKLKNLTKAIYKCGYSWDEQYKDAGFFHPKNGLILNFKGLHYYTPKTIIDTYNRTWSKNTLEREKQRERKTKSFKSCLLVPLSFLSLFFVDFKYALIIISLFFIRFIYYAVRSYADEKKNMRVKLNEAHKNEP
tara:strand:- start:113 stop:616 length:504 start_codon:yes stop_codon:yes gene_type:complete